MRLILGCVLILGDLLLRLLPAAVTIVIAASGIDGAGKKRGAGRKLVCLAVLSGVSHLLLYLLLHRLFLHGWNPFGTVREIVKVGFAYQDAGYFGCSLLISMAVSVVLGLLLKHTLFSGSGDVRHSNAFGVIRRSFLLLSAAAAGLGAAGCFAVSLRGAEQIVINEICGNNRSFFLGDGGTTPDYIELYNRGKLPCKLEGMYLSDSKETLRKKEIPACELPPGGYLLISLEDGSFSLKKEGGEAVYLSDASGKVWDSAVLGTLEADFSCARQTDGSPVWTVRGCTPGTANTGGGRWVQSPVLSHEGGFYKEAFDLALYAEPGAEIYYTLDGSVPTTESFLYQDAIHVYDRSQEPNVCRSVSNIMYDWLNYHPDETPVDKAFVIRAVAVIREAGAVTGISSPVTATYFIDLEKYRQRPTVSLTADPQQLFGPDGIYVTGGEYDAWYQGGQEGDTPEVNFYKRGKEWEIPVNLEYFSDTLNFAQNAGLRVNGGYIRFLPLKNFSIYARKEYGGSQVFDENLFEDVASHKLFIRGGLANSVCQALAENRNVAVQRYIPVSVFLNGEFWYHSNILEKYDDYYFMQRYGIDRDNIIVFKSGWFKEGGEEDRPCLQEIYSFLDTHDMAEASDYEAFGRLVDLQSYIDYMCINIYMDSMDFTDAKNVVMWRSRTVGAGPYEDGRWRWGLYDMDAMEWNDAGVWGYGSQAEKDTFSIMPRFTDGIGICDQTIFKALYNNAGFRRQFVLTFMDLVNEDFQYERAKKELDAYAYDPVGYQGGNDGGTQPFAYYYDFFRDRASYIVPCMAERFSLSGTPETVTLSVNDVEAGTVTLNTIAPDLSKGAWSGTYYTDYPVTAAAVPAEGYGFARWEITAVSEGTTVVYDKDSTVEAPVEKGGITLHAVFEKIE